MAAEHPHRFKRITASNTFLPTGAQGGSKAFTDWKNFAKTTPDFNVGKIVNGACHNPLSPEAIDAYNAPFANEHYKAGARIFPGLVPVSLEDPASHANISAWEVLMQWEKPFLTCFSNGDPITRGLDKYFQQKIPGAKNQKHITIKDAGHFVQEDKGEEWAEAIIQFIKET